MTKKRNAGDWSEAENKATAAAYFDLLAKQMAGETVNKAAIYRHLHSRFPRRSVKSFEWKFQNISAVLYESKRAYAIGLKPAMRYQAALRPVVLAMADRADDRPRPAIDILCERLRAIRRLGSLEVAEGSAGRYGLALERLLNIPANSSKDPDFMGIELKTKVGKTLQTLFSRVPSEYLAVEGKAGLLDRYGRDDGLGKAKLYTSFNSEPDSFGFQLAPRASKIDVLNDKIAVLSYFAADLEQSLTSKHNETAFIPLFPSAFKKGGFTLDRLLYCKSPTIQRFVDLCRAGGIYLDFTISRKGTKVKDHGFLWRAPTDQLCEIFAESREILL